MSSRNAQVFKMSLKQHANSVVKQKLVAVLVDVAQQMVKAIDNGFTMPNGTMQYPVYTANLHDATGVAVYSDGACQQFIPTKKATKMQSRKVDGNSLLRQAIANYASSYSNGVWLVLFSTTPYAYYINTSGSKRGRGVQYFETLKQNLLNDVIANLKPITT